jgi:predicted kinase
MHDISEYNGIEAEPLGAYHDRIKADIAEFMLKRMVGDVRCIKERAEFMNACVAAAATLAAGQSVVLAAVINDPLQRQSMLDTGKRTALRELSLSYDTYVKATLPPIK